MTSPYRPPPFAAADVEFLTALHRLADTLANREADRLAARVLRVQQRIGLAAITEALPDTVAVRLLVQPRQIGLGLGQDIGRSITRIVNAGGPELARHARERTGLEIQWPGSLPAPRGVFDFALARNLWAWINRRRAEWSNVLSREQADLLSAHLAIIERDGIGREDAARLLRGILGLSPQQAGWLFAWDAEWREQVAAGQITAARRRQLLSEARLNLATQRAARWARDHAILSLNTTQRAIMAGAVLLFPGLDENWMRESIAVGDGRVCPYCRARHGWRAPLAGRYQDGSNGPPWPHAGGLTTGCRCSERWVNVEENAPEELPPLARPSRGGRLEPAA